MRRTKFQGRKAASRAIVRQPSGISDRLFIRLRYSVRVDFTSTIGALAAWQFRGNGVFDPDVTGTGGQPYYFDQWAALYNRVRVHGSKIRVEASVPNPAIGSGAGNVTFVVVPSNNLTTFGATDSQLMREQPYSKFRSIRPFGASSPAIRSYMGTTKILGLAKKTVDYENDLSSATNGNPTSTWYWNVGMFTTDEATTSFATPTLITLTYYCEFYDKKRPALS